MKPMLSWNSCERGWEDRDNRFFIEHDRLPTARAGSWRDAWTLHDRGVVVLKLVATLKECKERAESIVRTEAKKAASA